MVILMLSIGNSCTNNQTQYTYDLYNNKNELTKRNSLIRQYERISDTELKIFDNVRIYDTGTYQYSEKIEHDVGLYRKINGGKYQLAYSFDTLKVLNILSSEKFLVNCFNVKLSEIKTYVINDSSYKIYKYFEYEDFYIRPQGYTSYYLENFGFLAYELHNGEYILCNKITRSEYYTNAQIVAVGNKLIRDSCFFGLFMYPNNPCMDSLFFNPLSRSLSK